MNSVALFLEIISNNGITTHINGFKQITGTVAYLKTINTNYFPKYFHDKTMQITLETEEKKYKHYIFSPNILGRFKKTVLLGKKISISPNKLQWKFRGKSYCLDKKGAKIKNIGN